MRTSWHPALHSPFPSGGQLRQSQAGAPGFKSLGTHGETLGAAHLGQGLPSQERAHDGRRRGGRIEWRGVVGAAGVALALTLHTEAGGVDVERRPDIGVVVGGTVGWISGLQYNVTNADTHVQLLLQTRMSSK